MNQIDPAGIDAMCRIVAANAGENFDALDQFTQEVLRDTQRSAITAYRASLGSQPGWLPCENARYEVSSQGEVRLASNQRLLSQVTTDQGYRVVRFSQPRSIQRVHRLVATAFLPNADSLPFVNHKDFNRGNNRSENLEWCTQWQNLAHSQQAGRMQRDYWSGRRSPSAKLTDEQAQDIRAEYGLGNRSWASIGEKYGISKRTVGRIIQGVTYV